MHFVAHRQPARNQRLQRDAAAFAQRASERGPQHVADPAQASEYLGIIAAEPHDLAEALVERAVRSISEAPILHHEQRLALGRHASHRPDRAVAVIGMKRE